MLLLKMWVTLSVKRDPLLRICLVRTEAEVQAYLDQARKILTENGWTLSDYRFSPLPDEPVVVIYP